MDPSNSPSLRPISDVQPDCRVREITFQVEEDVRLVVLEHLRDELDVHVLDIDLLMKPSVPDGSRR